MPADPRLLSDEELTAARSRHVQVFGWSMEPDPTNPGTMRHYCRFCARDDDLAPADTMDWRWPCLAGRTFDHIAAQADIIRNLTAERDLAIAHDQQPYPTADAYERACAALHRCEAERDRLAKVAEAAQVMSDNAGEGEYGGWEVSLARMDALDVALAALNPEVPNA